jgi:hypothetical protein
MDSKRHKRERITLAQICEDKPNPQKLLDDLIVDERDSQSSEAWHTAIVHLKNKNYNEAKNQLMLMAERKDAESSYNLGILFLSQVIDAPQLEDKNSYPFFSSAKEALAIRQFNLAAKYFRDAYDQGLHIAAKVKLELMFEWFLLSQSYEKNEMPRASHIVYHYNMVFGNSIRFTEYLRRDEYKPNGDYSNLEHNPSKEVTYLFDHPPSCYHDREGGTNITYIFPENCLSTSRQTFNILSLQNLDECIMQYPNDIDNVIDLLDNLKLAEELKRRHQKRAEVLMALGDHTTLEVGKLAISYLNWQPNLKPAPQTNFEPEENTEKKSVPSKTSSDIELNKLTTEKKSASSKTSSDIERLNNLTQERKSLEAELLKLRRNAIYRSRPLKYKLGAGYGSMVGLVVGFASSMFATSTVLLSLSVAISITASVFTLIGPIIIGALIGCAYVWHQCKKAEKVRALGDRIKHIDFEINQIRTLASLEQTRVLNPVLPTPSSTGQCYSNSSASDSSNNTTLVADTTPEVESVDTTPSPTHHRRPSPK